MNFTKHASFRMIRRGLGKRLAEIALKEGKSMKFNRDRILVTEEIVRNLRGHKDYPEKLIKKAEKSAPYVCVVKGNVIITIFRVTQRLNKTHAN